MPPESSDPRREDDELGRLFAALRAQRADVDADGAGADAAWDAAAGADQDSGAPRDQRAWLELGIADAVLAARGGSADAAAQQSARRVLARVRGDARGRGRRWWLGGAAAAAATWILATLLLSKASPRFEWSPVAVAGRDTRGGQSTGLDFRVRLRPDRQASPALFAVGWSEAGRDLQRLHPPIAAVFATADYAAWPRNPLAADTEVLLPPASMSAPFALAAATGFVLIVSVRDLDETAVASVQARLTAALPAVGGDEQAVRAAAAALVADGFAVDWTPLRVQ